jgi:peptidyl-prolyl cis-trans isomerase D
MLRFLRGATKRTKSIWWILIFLTVGTFVGGFVFLLGSGLSSGSRARAQGAAGSVNGHPITRAELQNAISDQREAYKRQYGSDPPERDLKMVELQAWRGLVTQKLLADQARALGITVRDREVVLTLESNPPAQLANSPVFQTNGKFDVAKYQQAIRDPKNNWAPFEELVRQQLPVRKLQERLISSIKLAEPELRESFRDRFEKASATVVQVPGAADSQAAPVSDADIARAYDQYKARFASGARTQLEVVIVPKRIGDEEVRAAREMAQGLVSRARQGEEFESLARDYSEGPGADKGGVVERYFQPADFGPVMSPKIGALAPGQVSDAFLDGSHFIIFKLLERKQTPPAPAPQLKVAQIVINVRPNETTLEAQRTDLRKLRDRAARTGLGRAAAEQGIATSKTEFYDFSSAPQALLGVPEAGDWGLTAKQNAVSPLFEGADEFAITQVAVQRAAGVPPREEISDRLRQFAELDARVNRSKATADKISQALAAGGTLEQAAQSMGLVTFKVENLTRRQPDPRLSAVPDLVGGLFAVAPGRVLGPVRALNGWYFARLDQRSAGDTTGYAAAKGQLTTEILQRRQQNFFLGFLSSLRTRAHVEDLRTADNN